mgnify:CR=1 FL=1
MVKEGTEALFEDALGKYRRQGIRHFEAQGCPGLHRPKNLPTNVDVQKYYKGSFVLEKGNGYVAEVLARLVPPLTWFNSVFATTLHPYQRRVSISSNLVKQCGNLPTAFPFVISNQGGTSTKYGCVYVCALHRCVVEV